VSSKRASRRIYPKPAVLQHDGVNSALRVSDSGLCEAHQTDAASVLILAIGANESKFRPP